MNPEPMGAQFGPGFQVSGSVTLVRQLGQGGMGSVWIAEHRTLHTQVVVKFMAPELAQDPTHLARFSREAAAASQVKSPHVVQIFDHGVTPGGADGIPYIVMELLEGHDLGAHMKTRRLACSEIVKIIGQLAKALTRAHDRGIIHRDIKPENIFLCDTDDDEPFVKLLDFGIALALSAGGQPGSTSSPVVVAAPGQVINGVVDITTVDNTCATCGLIVVFGTTSVAGCFPGEYGGDWPGLGASGRRSRSPPPRRRASIPSSSASTRWAPTAACRPRSRRSRPSVQLSRRRWGSSSSADAASPWRALQGTLNL
jgi:serine/threonine protein kinase